MAEVDKPIAGAGFTMGDMRDDEADDVQDAIRRSMQARGPQANLSFFAFTATPKAKTLEIFGTPGGRWLARTVPPVFNAAGH